VWVSVCIFFSCFEGTRGDKNQIFRTLESKELYDHFYNNFGDIQDKVVEGKQDNPFFRPSNENQWESLCTELISNFLVDSLKIKGTGKKICYLIFLSTFLSDSIT
jgi:hypothetical protein